MQQSGPVVSRHGLDIHGIGDVAFAYWNYATPALYEEALRRREGRLRHLTCDLAVANEKNRHATPH